MRNKIGVMVVGVIVVLGVYIMIKRTQEPREKKKYTVGVLQTASHPALDAVREGFIAGVNTDEVGLIIKNGQASIATIHTIAQQLSALEVDALIGIATPAARALVNVEERKPVGIAAVSVGEGMQEDLIKNNVYGVSDLIDVKAEIHTMHALLPNAKTIGILYTISEENSVLVVKSMEKELEGLGLNPVLIGISSEGDIEPALMSYQRKIDALIAPTDNTVASAIALVASITRNANIPLIVSDNTLVEYGALMARGVDYYQSGKMLAEETMRILKKEKTPQELSLVKAPSSTIVINTETAEFFKVVIPRSIENIKHV